MFDEAGGQLAFIVGHYKSGSTWLANLLSLHPEIRGVAETHVFRYSSEMFPLQRCTQHIFTYGAWGCRGFKHLARQRVAEWTRVPRIFFGLASGQSTLSSFERPTTVLDLTLRDQRRLRTILGGCASSDDYCRTFFRFLVDRLRPGRYLLEKTPTNIFYVPTIKRLFPQAKLIAVYRDGRDVAVSDKYYSELEHHRQAQLEQSIVKWKKAMLAQLEYAEPYGIFCLSYEELLAAPEEWTRRLLEFLELPTRPAVLSDMVRRSSFEFVTNRARGTEANAFYRKGVAGDWLNHFSEVDRAQFSRLAGELLVQLGYESSPAPETWAHAGKTGCSIETQAASDGSN